MTGMRCDIRIDSVGTCIGASQAHTSITCERESSQIFAGKRRHSGGDGNHSRDPNRTSHDWTPQVGKVPYECVTATVNS